MLLAVCFCGRGLTHLGSFDAPATASLNFDRARCHTRGGSDATYTISEPNQLSKSMASMASDFLPLLLVTDLPRCPDKPPAPPPFVQTENQQAESLGAAED
jgi:hypothetical protein